MQDVHAVDPKICTGVRIRICYYVRQRLHPQCSLGFFLLCGDLRGEQADELCQVAIKGDIQNPLSGSVPGFLPDDFPDKVLGCLNIVTVSLVAKDGSKRGIRRDNCALGQIRDLRGGELREAQADALAAGKVNVETQEAE